MPFNRWRGTYAVPLLAMLVFLLMGLAVLPYPGLQNDELFFVGPLYVKGSAFYQVHFGSKIIPVMLLSYLGAVKTWLYAPLVLWFPPTVWTIRLPMLLVGMLTIWLTWLWVRRIAGPRAAMVAAALLATDTSYLLTATFDWGPVVLQHLFLTGGLLAVQIWLDEPARRGMLALGLFLWGVGLWDKALLIWPLAGLGVALICIWPRQTWIRLRGLSFASVAIASVAFLIGAAPLVKYNLAQQAGRQGGGTMAANFRFSIADWNQKIAVLESTLRGDGLYGYLIYEPSGGNRRVPRKRFGRIADWIVRHAGDHRRNQMLGATVLALICFAVLWRPAVWRLLAFLLITIAVEWLLMALTKDAGGAVHHTILLWPFVPVFVAIAFSAMADRIGRLGVPLLLALVAVLVVENILTTSQFVVSTAEYGGYKGWSDAIFPLSDELARAPERPIGLVDWGYETQLEMLNRGHLKLFAAGDADRDSHEITAAPNAVFVQHTDENQMFAGVNERFRKAADAVGYTEKIDRVISDRNGRPVIEVFHLERSGN